MPRGVIVASLVGATNAWRASRPLDSRTRPREESTCANEFDALDPVDSTGRVRLAVAIRTARDSIPVASEFVSAPESSVTKTAPPTPMTSAVPVAKSAARRSRIGIALDTVSYTHLRAHETGR